MRLCTAALGAAAAAKPWVSHQEPRHCKHKAALGSHKAVS